MNKPDYSSVTTELNWDVIAPYAVLLGMAVLSILVLAFMPRRLRWPVSVGLTVFGLLAGFFALVRTWTLDDFTPGHTLTGHARTGTVDAGGPVTEIPVFTLITDNSVTLMQCFIVLLGLLSVLVMAERGRGDSHFTPVGSAVPGSAYETEARKVGLSVAEVFPLLLFSVGGMVWFVAAGDLLSLFIALEVFSLPLYVMAGLAARRRVVSQEASLKYFLLGALASTFLLFGTGLLYLLTGSVAIADVEKALTNAATGFESANAPYPALLLVPVVLVLVGILFKVGAAPFHNWTPDVYEGSPTPVTGFMAACTKIAAFGALLRLVVMFSGIHTVVAAGLATVAVISMVVGVTSALGQTSVKRMLAYSSVAHAGFVLTAYTVVSPESTKAVLFYLIAYGFTTVASFALLTIIRERSEDGSVVGEARTLEQWRGLGHRAPVMSAAFAFLMLATAGLPLTSGFMGKFMVFSVAVDGGYWWLALVGVLTSALAGYFYVRIIMVMYSTDEPGNSVSISGARPLTTAVIAIGVITTLVLGVFPSLLLDLTENAGGFASLVASGSN